MISKFSDVFQLFNLAFFLVVFIGRSLILWFRHGINPFALGKGKKGLGRMLELLLLPWLAFWMLAVAGEALHLPFQPVRVLWNPAWPDWLPAQVLGVLVILAGDTLFAAASYRKAGRAALDRTTRDTRGDFLLQAQAVAGNRPPVLSRRSFCG